MWFFRAARSVVIDGSWEMVKDGFHREAMFPIATMRAICQATIQQDATEDEQMLFAEQYMKLLADLGLSSSNNYQKRAEDGAHLLDEVKLDAVQMFENGENRWREKHQQKYPVRRPWVHAELRAEGWVCNYKQVARLMRQEGIQGRRKRRKVTAANDQAGENRPSSLPLRPFLQE